MVIYGDNNHDYKDIETFTNNMSNMYSDVQLLFVSSKENKIECINPKLLKENSEEYQRLLKVIEYVENNQILGNNER